MNRPARRVLHRWLLALGLFAGAPGGTGCNSAGGGDDKENPMLDDLLGASSDRAFQAALKAHGRISPEEIPALRQATEGWSEKRRRNAVAALALMDDPEALEILRGRAAETRDVLEWATAMRTLLDEPGAAEIANSRPEMVTRALQDDDGFVKGVGFSAALIGGREDAISSLEEQLSSPVRTGIPLLTDALNHTSPGRYEARLLALYQAEPDGVIADALATTLARGTDAASGEAIQARLLRLEPKNRGGHLRALQLGTAPWVRPALLDLAGRDDPDRTAALRILIRQGPAADWMRVCVSIFEQTPPRDPEDPVWGKWNIYQEPCREWATEQAGSPQDADAALARARAWLAEHAPPEPAGP